MPNIERISRIEYAKLDQERYFQSLFEEARYHKLLTEEALEQIQLACLAFLAYKVQRYNGIDSSSIQIEKAESIMQSILFTVGLRLKSFQNADDAVKALEESEISELYEAGRKLIGIKLKAAKHLYLLCMKNKLDTDNYYYNVTLTEGIKGFFKVYDPEYGAHEIPITADYPLCNPIGDLAGIEFIQRYLGAVYYENMFCRYFSSQDIRRLLLGYEEDYKELLFNIFEVVLTSALGSVLAGVGAAGLHLEPGHIAHILSDKSKEEIAGIIDSAYKKLIGELSIKNVPLQRYIRNALPAVLCKINSAAENHTLDKVFSAQKTSGFNNRMMFSFGAKMEDEAYRAILDEIMDCRFISDKLAIIKNKIRTLADLDDVLLDAQLSGEETAAVLHALAQIEIAALLKRHPYQPEFEADLREDEKEFRLRLQNFTASLPEEEQLQIKKAVTEMIIK